MIKTWKRARLQKQESPLKQQHTAPSNFGPTRACIPASFKGAYSQSRCCTADSTVAYSPKKIRRLRVPYPKLLLTCALCVAAPHLSAAVIFMDDFERSNSSTVGPEWEEVERDSSDVAIYNNQLRMRDQSGDAVDAAVINDVDISSFQNLTLSFDWRATSNTESSDTLYLGWFTRGETEQPSSWVSIWTQALGGSDYLSESISLSAASNPLAQLAFWIDVSSATETVYLDNILLEGDPLTSNVEVPPLTGATVAVPEPSSSLLLLGGLIGLMHRRQRGNTPPG